MKNKTCTPFLMTSIFLFAGCSYETINADQLVEREELYYKADSGTLFSGIALEYDDDGRKTGEVGYKRGKMHGKFAYYWSNGRKMSVGSYSGGEQDGLFIDWHENGQEGFKGNFKKGIEDGVFSWWDENGELTAEETYDNGRLRSIMAKASDAP